MIWRYQKNASEAVNQRQTDKTIQQTSDQKKKKDENTNNSSKHTIQKTKDWATGNLQNTGGELRCSGRLSISCSNSGILPVTHVKNLVISHELEKNGYD